MTTKLFLSGLYTVFLLNVTAFSQSKPKGFKYIDKTNMDEAVKPGDNFYLYANGTWIKKNPVPASKTRWGSFDMLRGKNYQEKTSNCNNHISYPTSM